MTTMIKRFAGRSLLVMAACATSLSAVAQDEPCHHNLGTKPAHGAHGGHMMKPAEANDTPSTLELRDANTRMHKDMDITYSGDVDIDFLRGMIAHHQGAVEMAQVQLKYGKDAQVRRLSQDIIRAQNVEIRWMKRWLAQLEANGAKPSTEARHSGTWTDEAWTGKTWLNER